MAAKIIDLTNPDDLGKQFASVVEAEQAFSDMLEKFKRQQCTVTKQQSYSKDFSQFKVVDCNDNWVGSYTIIVTD